MHAQATVPDGRLEYMDPGGHIEEDLPLDALHGFHKGISIVEH
jgi:hypothetical protein